MNVQQARNSSASFFLAFQRCMEQRSLSDGTIQWPVGPAIVCAAFSIEVGLKTLILKASGSLPGGHELAALFGKLSLPLQNAIRARLALTESDFNSSLLAANRAFSEWRYVYECQAASSDIGFLDMLARAIQDELDS